MALPNVRPKGGGISLERDVEKGVKRNI